MKPITDRINMVLLGILAIIVGVISPRVAREQIFGEPEPLDPVKIREEHRKEFLKRHKEMVDQ
jgi:hypothetical protein